MVTSVVLCNKLKGLLKYYQELEGLSHGVTQEIYQIMADYLACEL